MHIFTENHDDDEIKQDEIKSFTHHPDFFRTGIEDYDSFYINSSNLSSNAYTLCAGLCCEKCAIAAVLNPLQTPGPTSDNISITPCVNKCFTSTMEETHCHSCQARSLHDLLSTHVMVLPSSFVNPPPPPSPTCIHS